MRPTGKRYSSVSELVRDTSAPDVADEFERRLASRSVINSLAARRGTMGLTYADVAARMGLAKTPSQSGADFIEALEYKTDAEIGIAMLTAYARVVGVVPSP